MSGGKRNPLSMTAMLQTIEGLVPKSESESRPVDKSESVFVDLEIQFIGASGLPKMDVVGTADPYFVAKLDDHVSFVSNVIKNTDTPVWNELWKVKNVPTTATLRIVVMDKDEGRMTDGYVGEFEMTVEAGAKELEIQGPMLRKNRGHFWLKIEATPTSDPDQALRFPYLFDGPIRYSRHFSPTVGLFTNLDEARLYSTWKIYLRGVPLFFGDTHQHWNAKHATAANIFQGPASLALRSGIQAGHRMLYARTATNRYGVIENTTDLLEILHAGSVRRSANATTMRKCHMDRVKPAVYTYIISSEDESFRFSETDAAFFVDYASKHALQANCSETVRYSGEFHPRPRGGWKNFSDDVPDGDVDWELVVDNSSGTYAPDEGLLPKLKELLEFNFPGLGICAWDRKDGRLGESVEECREYAMRYRGVGKDESQSGAAEVTTMRVQDGRGGPGDKTDPALQAQDVTTHGKGCSTSGGSSEGDSGNLDTVASCHSSTTSAPSGTPP